MLTTAAAAAMSAPTAPALTAPAPRGTSPGNNGSPGMTAGRYVKVFVAPGVSTGRFSILPSRSWPGSWADRRRCLLDRPYDTPKAEAARQSRAAAALDGYPGSE